jgi:hypothetical protein
MVKLWQSETKDGVGRLYKNRYFKRSYLLPHLSNMMHEMSGVVILCQGGVTGLARRFKWHRQA